MYDMPNLTHTGTGAIVELIAVQTHACEATRRRIEARLGINCTRIVALRTLVHVCNTSVPTHTQCHARYVADGKPPSLSKINKTIRNAEKVDRNMRLRWN